jgi:teichuronic acid exporter
VTGSLEHLYAQARRGWWWGGLDQFIQRGLGLVVGLLLARLLEPSAFGLLAAVGIFIGIAQQFIDGGLSQRVLQKPQIAATDYAALFWCSAFMSLICFLALTMLAKPIARFFGAPELQRILVVLGFVLVLMNAGRVQATWLVRELRFRTASLINTCSVIAGCVTGLLLAWNGFGVWALVGQQAVAGGTRAVSLWIIVPRPFAGRPSWSTIKDLYAYGLPLILSDGIRTVADQWINVLIARRGMTETLGFYDRGRIIPQNFAYSLANIFSRSNMPVLARLQHDAVGFRLAYLHMLRTTATIYFLTFCGLAVAAPDVIRVILGERWFNSVWFLQAACAAFAAYALFASNSELLRARGLTCTLFVCNGLCAVFQIAGVLIGTQWGVRGMILGDVAGRLLACGLVIWAAARFSPVTMLDQARALAMPLSAALGLGLVFMLIQKWHVGAMMRFLLFGLCGSVLLALCFYSQRRKTPLAGHMIIP